MNINEVLWNFSDNGTEKPAKTRFLNFCNFWTACNFLMWFSLLCSREWALSLYMCVFTYTGVSLKNVFIFIIRTSFIIVINSFSHLLGQFISFSTNGINFRDIISSAKFLKLFKSFWSKKISNDQELIQSDPTSCPQSKREITKYINWQQFTKGTRGKPNEQFFPKQVVIQLPKIYKICHLHNTWTKV